MKTPSQQLKTLAEQYSRTLEKRFANNLKAVVLFGSVARDEARNTSDIDLLLIFKTLPQGRRARRDFLGESPEEIEAALAALRKQGIYSDFVEHLKTVDEIEKIRTPFLYEIAKDGAPLYDPEGIFKKLRQEIEKQMKKLGSQWKWIGKCRYLDFKPDYKPGDIFEI